jgi:integrase
MTPCKGAKPVALRDEHGHKVKGLHNEADAWKASKTVNKAPAASADGPLTAGMVCDTYLSFLKAKRQAKTYSHVKDWLTDFLRSVGDDHHALTLTPKDLTGWIDGHAGWKSPNTQRTAMRAVMAAFSYSLKNESPFKGVDTPKTKTRRLIVTQEQEQAIFSAIKATDPARDYLRFLLLTGCRPEEAAIIEARHVIDTPEGVVVALPAFKEDGSLGHKTGRYGEGEDRLIVCNPEASSLIRALVVKYPGGVLFRTKTGGAWLAKTRQQWFARVRTTVEKVKGAGFLGTAEKHNLISLYIFRHTFATRTMQAKQSLETVATLLGNSEKICAKHYGHLDLCRKLLFSASNAAFGGNAN